MEHPDEGHRLQDLEEVLINLLDLSEESELAMGWEMIDWCLRCFSQCCSKQCSDPESVLSQYGQCANRIFKSQFTDDHRPLVAVRETFEYPQTFLNFLESLWRLVSEDVVSISADIKECLCFKEPEDLMSLLLCAGNSLLDRGMPSMCIFFFFTFGQTIEQILGKLRQTWDRSAFSCGLLCSKALREMGSLEASVKILLEISNICWSKCRLFGARCEEELVLLVLSLSNRYHKRSNYHSSYQLSALAYELDNVAGPPSNPIRSVNACDLAVSCLLRLMADGHCVSHLLIETWLQRGTRILQLPNMTVKCLKCALRSVLNLLFVDSTLQTPSPTSVESWTVVKATTIMFLATEIHRKNRNLTSSLTNMSYVIVDLLLIVCTARRKSSLVLPSLRTCCKAIAKRGTDLESVDDFLSCLSDTQLCIVKLKRMNSVTTFLISYLRVIFHMKFLTLGVDPAHLTIVNNKVDGESDKSFESDPGVSKTVIAVLADELRSYGKGRSAAILLEAFKTWPGE